MITKKLKSANKTGKKKFKPNKPKPVKQGGSVGPPRKSTTYLVQENRSLETAAARKCAAEYSAALVNPFALPPETPLCYPGLIAQPSYKFRVRSTGSFTTSADGRGGVGFWPFRMATRDSVNNGNAHMAATIATGPTYAQSDYVFCNTSAWDVTNLTCTVGYGYNSPYVVADLAANTARALRLVAAGLRVWYEGKLIDTAGRYIIYRHTHPTIGMPPALDSQQDLTAMPSTAVIQLSANATPTLAYRPILEADVFMQPTPMTLSNTVGIDNAAGSQSSYSVRNRFAGGIFVEDSTAGAKFYYEAIAYFELIGQWNTMSQSHSAPASLGPLVEVANHAPVSVPAPVVNNFLSGAVRGAKDSLRKRAPAIARDLGKMVGEAALGRFLGVDPAPR